MPSAMPASLRSRGLTGATRRAGQAHPRRRERFIFCSPISFNMLAVVTEPLHAPNRERLPPHCSFIEGSPKRIQVRRTSRSVVPFFAAAAACPIVMGCAP
jgi:hypothetical protein